MNPAGRDVATEAVRVAPPGIARGVRQAARSIAELNRITVDATLLRGTVPDGDLIFRAEPDELNNRVIVTVSALSDRLLAELAARFGTEAVAVRVDPEIAAVTPAGRQDDNSPFYGGADIRTPQYVCTSGFPWRNGSLWQEMLTAGHCAPNGGNVSTPTDFMGSVVFENWSAQSGTTSWPGEPGVFRGDLALIQMAPGKSVAPRIWTGPWNSNVSHIVRSVWLRASRPGDDICAGGQTTGELCYEVSAVGVHAWYVLDGWGMWARNVVESLRNRYTGCIEGGDSGGSVFTWYQDGVAAKGIMSGSGGIIGTCVMYYTDIQHADQTLPGGTWASP